MDKPKMVIAAGNGFLGTHLAHYFRCRGYRVVVISRTPGPGTVAWDAQTLGAWAQELEGAAVLINLAGRSVDCRYTEANKRDILRSRVDSTRVLGEAVLACEQPPAVWLNASTATIYADTQDEAPANTEATGRIGEGFSVAVAQAWEAAFWASALPATRRVALRTAVVLGPDGGAFPVLAQLARLGLATPQGGGQQWISWLHVEDFCRAVAFLISQPVAGAVNLCAPAPLRNRDFNALLRRKLRPWLALPQPRWLLELGALLLRTETELILKSRKVVPARLLELGFSFHYPTCEQALDALLAPASAAENNRRAA
jgi:uncharacterized protein (TIGR01777 family)